MELRGPGLSDVLSYRLALRRFMFACMSGDCTPTVRATEGFFAATAIRWICIIRLLISSPVLCSRFLMNHMSFFQSLILIIVVHTCPLTITDNMIKL